MGVPAHDISWPKINLGSLLEYIILKKIPAHPKIDTVPERRTPTPCQIDVILIPLP